jgi:hypothetical protein
VAERWCAVIRADVSEQNQYISDRSAHHCARANVQISLLVLMEVHLCQCACVSALVTVRLFAVNESYIGAVPLIKGIGSILFLKNGFKNIRRKNYKNHLRSINSEICTAVALCFPNILDVMIL